ncbi:AtpZ/AtpI family protein [Flavobacterium sp.]|uniref:AtpZ/AtpI family protein n=1 Tax=Flavobacterium sp. TaxID=239 RepID=UPI0026145CBF|nr:AtpZ/AtpI family protein [Flavobacterium sp.]
MQQNSNNNPNKWLLLSTMGIEMFAWIFAGHKLGEYVNQQYPESPADYHVIFLLVGIALAFYSVFRKLKDLNS